MYSGSVVKTKILYFYNKLIWLISNRVYGEDSETLPNLHICIKLYPAIALLDIAFSRCVVVKGRRASFKVVSVDVTSNRSSCFLDVVILRQINLLVLETAKPAFNHDAVSPATFSVHALADIIFFYKLNILLACKLATLI